MSTIAIVGAGPGLGAATARRFGRQGFDVALIARDRERVDALAAQLTESDVPALGYTADVRKPETISAALADYFIHGRLRRRRGRSGLRHRGTARWAPAATGRRR